jgi:hypothetical protein
MKRSLKTGIIVAISVIVGVTIGGIAKRVVAARSQVVAKEQSAPKSKRMPDGSVIKFARGQAGPAGPQKHGGWHRTMRLTQIDRENGQLNVRASFHVNKPDRSDIHFAVLIRVRDYEGNVFVDDVPIGEGADIAGKANWRQDWVGRFNLAPGRYFVEAFARIPNVFGTDINGNQIPADVGAVGEHMIVN